MPPKAQNFKKVEALKHDEAKRKSIPTAEYQSGMVQSERDIYKTDD